MSGLRPAAAYARVSTKRQAEHETSLDEQVRRIAAEAERQGYEIVEQFVDAGVSGTTDRRPQFQKMITAAKASPRKFDAVFVYNFSRFARDEFHVETYRRELLKADVQLISATQQIADGPHARVYRSIITSMDAAYSEINAAQVQAAMTANAADGFWNGSKPPFGYETCTAERRGKKDKKRLRILETEAATVREIFEIYVGRKGSENLGCNKIAQGLQNRGITYRGTRFSARHVNDILRRETYTGRHYYNRTDSKTRKERPREDWVEIAVPAIIDQETFEIAAKLLATRDPKMSPARSHSSSVLLSRIARCGKPGCDHGTMMLMTGKGGRYRYYTCSNVRRKNDRACGGNNVKMEIADEAVLSALEQRIFEPRRLRSLLDSLLERSTAADSDRKTRLQVMKQELTSVEKAASNLLQLVENGMIDAGDPTLKDRFANNKARRLDLLEQIDLLERQLGNKSIRITEDHVRSFAVFLRNKIRATDDLTLRKRYVQAFVSTVTMTNECIEICGTKSALEAGAAAFMRGDEPVRTSMADWRARQDSNL